MQSYRPAILRMVQASNGIPNGVESFLPNDTVVCLALCKKCNEQWAQRKR
jgi:hypothetical protein